MFVSLSSWYADSGALPITKTETTFSGIFVENVLSQTEGQEMALSANQVVARLVEELMPIARYVSEWETKRQVLPSAQLIKNCF